MTHKILIISLLITLFTTGCVQDPKINVDKTPKIQITKQVQQPIKRKGALYSRKGASLFADKKDLQLGDIIQVLIEETLTNESSDSRTITKNNSTSIGGGLFTTAGDSPSSGTSSLINKLNASKLSVGFGSETDNSFNGSASSDADEEFTTTISAVIEQTYQNGNYFIKGSKEMLINGQKQNIKISGVIRPYDISPENTVYSYQLANLKILYQKDGSESESLKKGWGTRFLETISPF